VVSWTSMIRGYVKHGMCQDGFLLFLDMRSEGVQVNETALSVVLDACSEASLVREGIQIHGLIIAMGFEMDVFLGDSIIIMYSRFGWMVNARRSISKMSSQGARLPRFTSPVSFEGISVYRQYFTQLVCVFTFAVLCQQAFLEVDAASNYRTCFTGTYDANTNYFPETSAPTTANDYTLTYFNNYKVLNDTRAKNNEVYVLYQCGTPMPNAASFPSGTKFFSVPVTAVATEDTTSNAFLNALGPNVLATVQAVQSGDYFTTPCIQQRLNAGSIQTLDSNKNLPAGLTVSLTFGSNTNKTGTNEVEDSAAYESSPVKRAEWLKYYAAFYNAESTANAVYNYIVTNYNGNKTLVTSTDKPVFAFVSGYQNTFYVSQTGFKTPLIADAGGQLANLAPQYNDAASLFAALNATNTTYLIDESYFFGAAPTLSQALATYGLNTTTAQQYKWAQNFYREDKIVSGGGGLSWFDDGEVFGDVVLADFINVLNSSLPFPSYSRKWLRNVYTETPYVVTGKECANPIYKTPTNSVTQTTSTYNSATGVYVSVAVVAVLALLF